MAPNHKMTQHSVHVVLQCHVTNKNHYISFTRVPMATKLDTMVTYLERLLTKKSFYGLITWSCKVTWQKNSLYLYYKSAYGKQTWQNHDFVWWAATYNNKWPFDHAALWDTRLSYMRRFSIQTLKSSPTSCLNSIEQFPKFQSDDVNNFSP